MRVPKLLFSDFRTLLLQHTTRNIACTYMKNITPFLTTYLNQYHQTFSISLPQKLGILFLIALFINHLNGEERFPLNDDYEFPLVLIAATMLLGTIKILVSDLNFIKYKNHYFKAGVTEQSVGYFGITTLFYHFLIYLPIYFGFNWLLEENYEAYNLIAGLSITLLISIIGIIGFYATDIYRLFKSPIVSQKLTVKNGAKTTLVPPAEIAYFYSKNKIVYLVKANNERMATNFTLNQLETQLDATLFFRANRQFLLQAQSVHQVKHIENGKLAIQLMPANSPKEFTPIIISRYKKQAFLDWFQQKL